MKDKKSVGEDGIPAEILKADIVNSFFTLLIIIWNKEQIQDRNIPPQNIGASTYIRKDCFCFDIVIVFINSYLNINRPRINNYQEQQNIMENPYMASFTLCFKLDSNSDHNVWFTLFLRI